MPVTAAIPRHAASAPQVAGGSVGSAAFAPAVGDRTNIAGSLNPFVEVWRSRWD